MSQQVATFTTSILPAPMSAALDTAVRLYTSRLDPAGTGFTIAKADAPDDDTRQALQRRADRLANCLAPAGELFVAKLITNLSTMKKRNRSEREAEVAAKQLVKGLADLPAFALEQAAADFLNGSYGDRWFPDLSDIRPHALTKLQPVAQERRVLDKVLTAKVRDGSVDPDRKARLLAIARAAIPEMRLAGMQADPAAKFAAKREKLPETQAEALAALARLAADKTPLPPLSDAAKRGMPVERTQQEANHG